ncbi:uncharacterized protein HaLaN_11754 [Haematococcus lacustris]|uniref:Mitochondrial ribosomal protein L13 n=1 Tax=Haematococcus lacustris TaxID=44745 RepID=A0A699Z1X2_HAELA|nr:uncharacterized protein HaLaN_11754 [Haematococcus lacustris]
MSVESAWPTPPSHDRTQPKRTSKPNRDKLSYVGGCEGGASAEEFGTHQARWAAIPAHRCARPGQSTWALIICTTRHMQGRAALTQPWSQVVGTLATQISTLLQGKDKPTYSPKRNMGDVVIVINAAHVHFTHDKWATKSYAWHTGWPGGFRERPALDQWERDPTSILVKAVNGMLPKNRLRPYRMDKLKVFPEADHPFSDLPLVPYVPAAKRVQRTGLSWSLPEGLQPMNPEIFAFRAWTGSQRASQPPQQQQQQQQPPVAQLLSASAGQAAGSGTAEGGAGRLAHKRASGCT